MNLNIQLQRYEMEFLICKFYLITQYSGSSESSMILEVMPPWKAILEMRNGNEVEESDDFKIN